MADLALTGGMAVALASSGEATSHPSRAASPVQPAREVYLLPLGGFPRDQAAALAHHVRRTLGTPVAVQPSAALARASFDRARKQYVAEGLLSAVRSRRNASNPAAVAIGLTAEDMYSRGTPSYRYVFGQRSTDGLAVVSTARMNPRFFGLHPDPGLRMRRSQKMVVRSIGVLAQGRPLNQNPRSVLYDTILSTDDLDFMTQEFRPPAPSPARRAWLTRTARVCERGIVENKALTARSTVATPADFLALAEKVLALEQRHNAQLAAISPGPEDRRAVRSLLRRLARAAQADRQVLRTLRTRWNEASAARWLREGLRLSLALKSSVLELGSRSCTRYFDPATYG